jgi:hypothetical protein
VWWLLGRQKGRVWLAGIYGSTWLASPGEVVTIGIGDVWVIARSRCRHAAQADSKPCPLPMLNRSMQG